MYMSSLAEVRVKREVIDTFLGYNNNLKIKYGEFTDMQNLSSSNFPLLSPRKKRATYAEPENVQGIIAKDSLCYVDGTDFVINGYHINIGLSTDSAMCPKSLVSMGAYVIILPDKKYINTQYADDYGDIEVHYASTGTVTYTMCNVTGTDYENMTVSSTEPVNPENGALWVDTSGEVHVLKQYTKSTGMWVSIATTYVKIGAKDIAKEIKEGDGIKIDGIKVAQLAVLNGQTSIVQKAYHDPNDGAGDYIIVTAILDAFSTQTDSITAERTMPQMEYVIESENRLWGCHYGMVDGKMVNEIYASKLGDFKNWNCFQGLSTDSYTASCGTDGEFTGAITYLGYPLFFKENAMHKVYGNYPANYQIQAKTVRGVQQGSSRSLVIVNEVLYYKSRNGVCAYDGSLPAEISNALGDRKYSYAVAGGIGNKYYISMMDESGVYHLFVYDAQRGLWHREDETKVDYFCTCKGELYFIEAGKIRTINGTGTEDAGKVKWYAETGNIGTDSPERNYIARVNVRMRLDIGTKLTIMIRYDSNSPWEPFCTLTGTTLKSFSIPIRPRRCDHFRLRFVGEGYGEIHSITNNIEKGSDE